MALSPHILEVHSLALFSYKGGSAPLDHRPRPLPPHPRRHHPRDLQRARAAVQRPGEGGAAEEAVQRPIPPALHGGSVEGEGEVAAVGGEGVVLGGREGGGRGRRGEGFNRNSTFTWMRRGKAGHKDYAYTLEGQAKSTMLQGEEGRGECGVVHH